MLSAAGLALAAVAAPAVGPPTAAYAEFPPHTVTPQFDLVVQDANASPIVDQLQRFVLSGASDVVVTTHQREWTFKKCLGEVTVTGKLTVKLDSAGVARTTTEMSLFRGAGCAMTERSGSAERTGQSNGTGATTLPALRVNDTKGCSQSEIVAGDCDFAEVITTLQDDF